MTSGNAHVRGLGRLAQLITKDHVLLLPACQPQIYLLLRPEPNSLSSFFLISLEPSLLPPSSSRKEARKGGLFLPSSQLCLDTPGGAPHSLSSLLPSSPPCSLSMFLLIHCVCSHLCLSQPLPGLSLFPPSSLTTLSPYPPRESIQLVPAILGPLCQLSLHLANSAL